MGKLGDTWRLVETITKTGETDQGVTLSTMVDSNQPHPTKTWCCLLTGLGTYLIASNLSLERTLAPEVMS